ncbi:glycosyltransferase family 2 protein [Paenibacillus paeoniae]|uniref:Glycosyltransferase n=1 Tax=Paenibacillus paeoniae TaxID=2292705 RepID=A0A371PFW0_9BACL|nr:glycosyltransferase family 2 protein [Paenibacillus paeoniae]REK74398.1 glycosyltransferase [Paenibacillus paeoniae]
MYLMLYLTTGSFLLFQMLYTVIPLLYSKVKKLDITLDEKSLSVLVPAYNEEKTIQNCLDAMDGLHYRNYEIIIVNDGSRDRTFDRLQELLDLRINYRKPNLQLKYKRVRGFYQSALYPHIFVLDKLNGGKADSLNAGIDYADGEIVITLDADSMLESNSLKYVNQYFHDPTIVALGGTVKIAQGAKRKNGEIHETFTGKGIVRSQMINYIHSFYVRKLTQSYFNSIVVISGAFGAFYKELMYEVNGFRSTVGEDIDITLKIHEYIKTHKLNQRLVYAPEAVCYTECPEDLKNFYKQRIRWQKAFVDCVLIYWSKLSRSFKPGISIFFAIDGFIMGTVTVFTTFFYLIDAAFSGSSLLIAFMLFIITTIINALQLAISFLLCRKYGSHFTLWEYTKMMVFSQYDLISYRLVLMYVNIIGTIKYFDNDNGWGFVERKGVASIGRNTSASAR